MWNPNRETGMKASVLSMVVVFISFHYVTSAIQCEDTESFCASFTQNNCRDKPDAFKRICKKSCGVCTQEQCSRGYYGNDCAPCKNLFLHGNKDCGKSVGQACAQDCQSGHYGANCEHTCSSGCDKGSCDKWSGYCIHGCKSGYHGNLCKKSCPVNCKSGKCERLRHICVEGCKTGWYGPMCSYRCPVRCPRNVCDIRTGDCSHSCQQGWFGKRCDTPCPENCFCDRISGQCTKCHHGWSGDSCLLPCPTKCVNGSCSEKALCTNGCESGWYGKTCNMTCPVNCILGVCDADGCTVGCTRGWYGQYCSKQCQGCWNQHCSIKGTCLSGCRPGLYGERCGYTCPDGCLNNICRSVSGELVSTDDKTHGLGNLLAGQCTSGCKTGYFGEFCNLTCTSGCSNSSCPQSGNCGNDTTCNQNGTCSKQCGICAKGTPPSSSAESTDLTIVAWVVVGVSFLVGLVAAWRFVHQCRRRGGSKYLARPPTIRDNSEDGYYMTVLPD